MNPNDLSWLNSLAPADAIAEFLKCCGSTEWASRIEKLRPFLDVTDLNHKASTIWWDLDPEDWLEAFRSHPKIGEKKATASVSSQAQAWSTQEQAVIATSSSQVLDELASLNREYEEKFGYIFIVCATGKSSEAMLEILKSRIGNDSEAELPIAATEQAKITELRLEKLVAEK